MYSTSLSDLGESLRVVRHVISGLVVRERLLVLRASVKALAYSDIRGVEVVVSLEDLEPVVDGRVVHFSHWYCAARRSGDRRTRCV